jgi:DNA primase
MNYYEELTSQNDILEVAQELGFEPRYEGRIAQGECPGHPSSKGKCLTIYNSTQSFYCFHCNQGGDVIDLVRLFKDWDHQDAVNFLADRVGIPRLAASKLAAEAKTSLEAEYNEIQLVYDMLTEAAIWFHKQLDNYPEIKEHLINTYKFSEKIIEELKIGFAPPTNSTQKSILADHLKKNPRFQKKLLLSGLFIPFLPNRVIDYFQGRIMFPYWSYGKVVFFKGRATKLTPVNTYECYSLGDGAHPAEYIKYKALRVHDPNDEKRKYISKVIKGDVFLGQIGGSSKKVVITEGVPDWVSAIDHGFQAISPGATNFKKEALDKLAHRLRDKSVYLIFDNDANEAGQKAALELGKVLMEQGILAYIVDLPKAPEADKVDLNEYLRNHSANELSILNG